VRGNLLRRDGRVVVENIEQLHGQEIEITTLPPGVYYLTHAADPTNKWLELNDDNNSLWTKFQLQRDNQSGHASIHWLEDSPCTGLACGNSSNR
jgi:hypothetical protein